jgi:hypothetical protein
MGGRGMHTGFCRDSQKEKDPYEDNIKMDHGEQDAVVWTR